MADSTFALRGLTLFEYPVLENWFFIVPIPYKRTSESVCILPASRKHFGFESQLPTSILADPKLAELKISDSVTHTTNLNTAPNMTSLSSPMPNVAVLKDTIARDRSTPLNVELTIALTIRNSGRINISVTGIMNAVTYARPTRLFSETSIGPLFNASEIEMCDCGVDGGPSTGVIIGFVRYADSIWGDDLIADISIFNHGPDACFTLDDSILFESIQTGSQNGVISAPRLINAPVGNTLTASPGSPAPINISATATAPVEPIDLFESALGPLQDAMSAIRGGMDTMTAAMPVIGAIGVATPTTTPEELEASMEAFSDFGRTVDSVGHGLKSFSGTFDALSAAVRELDHTIGPSAPPTAPTVPRAPQAPRARAAPRTGALNAAVDALESVTNSRAARRAPSSDRSEDARPLNRALVALRAAQSTYTAATSLGAPRAHRADRSSSVGPWNRALAGLEDAENVYAAAIATVPGPRSTPTVAPGLTQLGLTQYRVPRVPLAIIIDEAEDTDDAGYASDEDSS